MRYILLIYENEKLNEGATAEDWEKTMIAHTAFGKEAQEKGMKPYSAALQPTAKSKTVRFEGSENTLITDGPFAETKEQLGGLYILDCDSEEEALQMAAKLGLRKGSIEVRPLIDFS